MCDLTHLPPFQCPHQAALSYYQEMGEGGNTPIRVISAVSVITETSKEEFPFSEKKTGTQQHGLEKKTGKIKFYQER